MNFDKLDRAYEEAYPRKTYSLYLKGDGILRYKKGFSNRVKHISEVKGIKEVDCAELQHNEMTVESRIKVVLSNYYDYRKLLSPWPSYAFGSGVEPEAMPIDNVYLFIMDVEVNLVVDSNRKMFRDCESVYGITNFERVTKKDGTKTKMVKCQPKTLFNLVDVLRHHIHLEPRKRVVKPCINHANTCAVCLSLGHKKCDKTIRCAVFFFNINDVNPYVNPTLNYDLECNNLEYFEVIFNYITQFEISFTDQDYNLIEFDKTT